MLSLVLMFLLIMGFLIGLRRGFILQLIHMIGFVISFIVAYVYYDDLAPKLRLWVPYPSMEEGSTLKMVLDGISFDDAFYRIIAFAIIFFAVRIVLGIIGSALDVVASLPILKTINVWAGGLLGLIEIYLFIFILLYIAALLPIAQVQDSIGGSALAKAILENTPVLSRQVQSWWLTAIQ